MRKIIISLLFIILFISLVSAEITITQQPDDLYNLGSTVETPIKIAAMTIIQETLHAYIICDGQQKEFYMNDIDLLTGEEKSLTPTLLLNKNRIGTSQGECKIKVSLGEEYILTNDFRVSNYIEIDLPINKVEFNPGESIIIEGKATKENGELVDGIAEVNILIKDSSENLSSLGGVKKGYFSINISLPEDIKADAYLVKLEVYEKNKQEEKTNRGFIDYNILINQIPTNLEILFRNKEVEPGTNLGVKAILHDQTGEKIKSSVIITIKDNEDKILEQTEKQTDEFLEFFIPYNKPPQEWKVVAVSNEIITESTFNIKEKRDINIEIINKTITITNTGNVLYEDNILIKIGDESLNINISLEVDESQKYILTAPDGEYQIEIISNGKSTIAKNILLTGKAIDIKKASGGVITLVRYPFVWIFIIGIFGFIAFIIFRKGYKKSFIGYIHSKRKEKKEREPLQKNSLIKTKNKAELSLSIKGDKQNVSLICIKIKNLQEIGKKKSGAEEILQKIVDIAEEKKAAIYESNNTLMFILAPTKTKTFKNEKTAVETAEKIKNVLKEYNKLVKQKIEFGVSLNYGAIVAKQEKDVFKFMSMGTLITTAKKISSVSDQEIFLSKKIKERLGSDIKTEKHKKGNTSVYTIKQIKNAEEHKKFIKSFLNRIEGKNTEGEKK